VKLTDYDILLVDLDGVVWLGGRVIEENVEALRAAADSGVDIVFVTNNSTRTRRYYAWKLSSLGLPARPESVVTSGYAASAWLARRMPGGRVYIVGEEGLAVEAYLAGLNVVDTSEALRGGAEAVLVGLDRLFTYQKGRAALRSLEKGALFVAANEDHVLPTHDGLDPGAGAVVAFLERASGRRPDFTAGKPSPFMARLALEGRSGRALVVGDRLDTDVEMARRSGLDAVLVLTGLTRRPPEPRPPSLRAVLRNLLEAI
jgi:4-nitrophenyl phosphatase